MPDPFYSPRRIQRIFSFLFICIVILVGTTNSCRRKADAVEPAVEIDTLAPKITNMHIPGIPPENIKIDQIKRQLIVTLPVAFTFTGIIDKVWLQISQGAKLKRFNNLRFDFCSGRFVNSFFEPVLPGDEKYDYRTLEVTDGIRTKAYRLQLKPAGEMYFDVPDKTFIMKSDGTGENFNGLRVVNFMDTLKSAKAVYKNLVTGDTTTFSISGCKVEGYKLPNYGTRNLEPGYYDIAIVKENGRKTAKGLRMTLTAGKPKLSGFEHALSQGYRVTIRGNSLYNRSLAGIELEGVKSKQKYALNIVQFSRDGTFINADLPATTTAGNYSIRGILSDGSRLNPERVLLLKTPLQPQFGGSPGIFFPNEYTDVLLKKDRRYYFSPTPIGHIANGSSGLWVFLQALDDPSQSYRIPVSVPSIYLYAPSPEILEGYPSFIIPANVRSSRYQLRLEYRDVSNVWQVGEWLDWYFQIQ